MWISIRESGAVHKRSGCGVSIRPWRAYSTNGMGRVCGGFDKLNQWWVSTSSTSGAFDKLNQRGGESWAGFDRLNQRGFWRGIRGLRWRERTGWPVLW